MIEIDDSEKIVRVVRKHWFVLIGQVIVLVLFVLIPPIAFYILHLLPFESVLSFSGTPLLAELFFLFAWLFIVWMIGWNMWTDYYLDVLLITDRRVFDIDQKGLFRRTSSSFRLDKVQNVTVDQKGVVETLFDFGTIRLETAGEREDFIASFIANPYEIKKFVNEMQDRDEERSQRVHFEPTAQAPNTTSI